MKYTPPIGGAANDPYVDANPATGVEGSSVPAAAIEHPQREIEAVISGAGITPAIGDLTQLRQAIQKMITGSPVIIEPAVFAAAVVTGNAVYWDAANSRFDQALADGTAKQGVVGFADVANGAVYAFGAAALFSGLTPGMYYLSGETAGAITAVAPANTLFVGIAKSATEMFVDIDVGGGITQAQADARYAGLAAVPGTTKGLVCRTNAATPASKVDASASELVVKNGAGQAVLLSAVSVTADIAVAGANGLDTGAEAANTWYYLWVIHNGATAAALLSLSATAPTMPAGYTHKALVSAVRNDGSSNFLVFLQKGNVWQYGAKQTVLSGGTATALTAVSLAAAVAPSVAISALLLLHKLSPAATGESVGRVYPSSASTAAELTALAFSGGSVQSGFNNGELLFENNTPDIFYLNSNGSLTVYVNGFRLAI